MVEIKKELKQENMAVKSNAIAKLLYVSHHLRVQSSFLYDASRDVSEFLCPIRCVCFVLRVFIVV